MSRSGAEDSKRSYAHRQGSPGQRVRQAALATAAIILAFLGYRGVNAYAMARELVRESPDQLPSRHDLLAYGNALGRSAFAANCASCHGEDLKGDRKKGVPNLTDDNWLYDYGRVSDIERTILYGIRSGLGKSHNVTDMPAIGRQKALAPSEIKDVIAFVLSLNKTVSVQDPKAVQRGERIFQDKGVCYDCHSRDGTGISDYGAPDLTDDDWVYGGDEETIYQSIYDGRHGRCPAWIGKLSFTTIRALAVYIHSMSSESPASPNRSAS